MDDPALVETLRAAVPGAAFEAIPSVDMPTLYVDRDHLVETCAALRDHPSLQFALLGDVTAVDGLPAEPRFELVYHLACLGEAYAQPGGAAPARRLRLKVRIAGADAHAPTVTPVYPTAGWCEREVFDLFGIVFDGHPDLRRILMTDDWEGHPLRKDYPVQIRKDTASWSPLQVTAEEFAANVRSVQDRALGQAEAGPFDALRARRNRES
jgi:NADH-quinone oxidoreductase subunit C